MSDFAADYRARLVSHEQLIRGMKPGSALVLGTWLGQPHGVLKALAEHGRHIDPLYLHTSPTTAGGEVLGLPNVRCVTTFLGQYERAARRDHGNVSYVPTQYTDARRGVRANRPADYYMLRVAPMDEGGYFNLSLSNSWMDDAVRWLVKHAPEARIVFEVNRHMPPVPGLLQHGDNKLHISESHYLLEDDTPPLEYAVPEPTATERAIAANVAQLVPDRATVQLGIGGIPMAIGKLLADRKELGIHSEMFCTSHLDLIEAGSVTNTHKGLYDGVSVATFALGEDRLYRWLRDNPAFAMLPVEEVNAVPVLARIRNLTSINSALTIDLSGQTCSHCLGPATYSGVGGAFEFAYGAQLSEGGKSIVCLPSAARLRDGREVSNVVFRHPAGTRVTLPEHCVDWVVTEHGAARLKFLTLEWRAAALIALAHPMFRDELSRQAVEAGLDLGGLRGGRRPPDHFFSAIRW